MFVSDRVVFLELQKTGCTHIRNLLQELVGGQLVERHNQASPHLFTPGRLFFGSVRDPWYWYLSLWAYGCDGKGDAFGSVTTPGRKLRGLGWRRHPLAAFSALLERGSNLHASEWKRTFRDVNDAGAFRQWLHMLHDTKYLGAVGEGFGLSKMSGFAGFFTYRYMRLFACKLGQDAALREVESSEALERFEHEHGFIDHFIRNERLESDLVAALEASGFQISADTRTRIASRPRTNTSSRKRGPAYYYDRASADLVARRDRLVIRRFGYAVPVIGCQDNAAPAGMAVGASA